MTDQELKLLLDYEILVDCHDEEEVAESWKIRAEEYLAFPFSATMQHKGKTVKLKVIALEKAGALREEDEYDGEEDYDDDYDLDFDIVMIVKALPVGAEVPISIAVEQLTVVDADEDTENTVLAWKYWKLR